MPQKRPAPLTQLHAPHWGDDEFVWIRSTRGWGKVLRAGLRGIVIPEGVDPQGLTEEQMRAYQDPVGAQIGLMQQMIVRWSLRYEPTLDQAGAGLPGDPMPQPTYELIEDLDEESGPFILQAITDLAQDPKPEGMTRDTFPGRVGPPGDGHDGAPGLLALPQSGA